MSRRLVLALTLVLALAGTHELFAQAPGTAPARPVAPEPALRQNASVAEAGPVAPKPALRQNAGVAEADKWAAEIAKFEAADQAAPFAPGGIVFVGSSSIRLWDLPSAFPGRRVLNRGFGGTQILDSVRHVDRLVIRHKPATVVFYAGDNDLSAGRTPQQVLADFQAFTARVHDALPQTRIAFIGIKPSIARWALIDKVREANRLVRALCDRDDRLGFVDVDAAMIGWDGKPRPELFVKDGLHMSPKGYAIWNTLVRPFIE